MTMTMTIARTTLVAAAATLAVATAGCNPAPAGSTRASTGRADTSASAAASDGPSQSAKMICQPEAADEIASAVGVKTSNPPTPTWSDHVYSCRYQYPSGVMVLSIKELPDEATTTAYYTAAQHNLPNSTPEQVLGQQGFSGPDGSVYVRKDFKVLHVDVSGLADPFGDPTESRADAAFTVAAVIMSCWTGN